LDEENDRIYYSHRNEVGGKKEMSPIIEDKLDVPRILRESAKKVGWWLCNGWNDRTWRCLCDARSRSHSPWLLVSDDEVVVVASERPAIQTAFNVKWDQVQELKPAHALIIKKNGTVSEERFIDELPVSPVLLNAYISHVEAIEIFTPSAKNWVVYWCHVC
jgi:amidophosphoribosyltransferase